MSDPLRDAEPVAWRHNLTHSLHDFEHEVQLADAESWAEPLYLRDAPAKIATPTGAAPSEGIEAAARWVQKRLDDYDVEHGSTDPETGTREYPGTGLEYAYELHEIIEGIRSLAAPTGAAPVITGEKVKSAFESTDRENAYWNAGFRAGAESAQLGLVCHE